jgi:hypothetical protein
MAAGVASSIVLGGPGSLIWMKSKLLFAILTISQLLLLFAGAFLSWRGRQYAAQASVESIITDTNHTCCTCGLFEANTQLGEKYSALNSRRLTRNSWLTCCGHLANSWR